MVPGQRRLFKRTLILMEVLVAKFGRPSLVPSNHTSSLCLSFCWPTSPFSLWFLSSPFCGDSSLLESHCLSRPASLPGRKVASSHSYFGSLPGTWGFASLKPARERSYFLNMVVTHLRAVKPALQHVFCSLIS